jgi:lipopolysaccharide/colanic/teichoic acid biosynthesis glycosyltransferase
VFFVQPRAGRHGRPFGLLKFRTMHPTDDAPSEWVLDNIHRITRVGRYLRRFRLDELPQLINVLRGEMNLIGPRPHPVSNHATFMEHIAYYGLRSTVRPGVTGWAQVRYGYANNLDEETEKMRYDLYYIKNRSLWLDFRILLATTGIVLFGQDGAQVRHPAPMGRDLSWPAAQNVRAGELSCVPVLADQGGPRPTTGPQ